MDAQRQGDDVILRMSYAEAVTLHEVLAYTEWAGTRSGLELRDPAEEDALDRAQQALQPLIPELGTDGYSQAVDRAWQSLRPRS